MFQQFQTSSTPPSTTTLARTGDPIVFLISSISPTWIIDSGASDHMTGNKGIVSSLDSTYYFPSVTLFNGSTSSVQGIGFANATSFLSLLFVL